jgi:hypothetical protein
MDATSKRIVIRTVLAAVTAIVVLFCGPLVIHTLLKAATDDAEITERKQRYELLDAEMNRGLDSVSFLGAGKEMNEIRLWCHVRGISLDGEKESSSRPVGTWREIFTYAGLSPAE